MLPPDEQPAWKQRYCEDCGRHISSSPCEIDIDVMVSSFHCSACNQQSRDIRAIDTLHPNVQRRWYA